MVDLTEKLFNESEEYIKSLGFYSHKKVNGVCPECGVEKNRSFSFFSKRGSTACNACLRKHKAFDSMIGEQYGRLLVLGFDAPKNGKPRLKCRCACGVEVSIIAVNLKRNGVKSCGCLKTEMLQGKNNPTYNPLLTEEERNYNRSGIQKWSLAVRSRDNFTCQVCGSKEKVVAHHLSSYKSDKEARCNLENGITLCRECHTDFHCNFMGDYRQPCNEEDFEQYLLQV